MLNFNISTFKVQNDHIFLNILNFNRYHWLQLTWKLKQVESDFRLKFHSPTRLNQILVWILIPPRLNLTGARLMHKHKAGAATDVTGWAEYQPHIWYMIYPVFLSYLLRKLQKCQIVQFFSMAAKYFRFGILGHAANLASNQKEAVDMVLLIKII